MARTPGSRWPYSGDLDWLVNSSGAALSERSGMGSIVATLERGAPATGTPNTDLYDDRQVGWCVGEGSVAKHRRLMAVWRVVGAVTQQTLVAYYQRGWILEQVRWLDRDAGLQILAHLEARLGERVAGVALLVASPEDRKKLLALGKSGGAFSRTRETAAIACDAAHDAWTAAARSLRAA